MGTGHCEHQRGCRPDLSPYLPVDTSWPVNQVAEFSSLVFGLKEKGEGGGGGVSVCHSNTLCNIINT